MRVRRLRVGDWVEVRPREEILATLDEDGCLDGMPFMPEMLRFCGQRCRVIARAHKTCDTVNNTGGVRVDSAVHLEGARCDGSAHDECQAACLLFWKEAWVQRVPAAAPFEAASSLEQPAHGDVLPRWWSIRTAPDVSAEEVQYRCQATELPNFTRPLAWWDVRQYIEDLVSGNIGVGKLFRGSRVALFRAIIGLGVGYRAWVAAYNWYQRMRGGSSFPWVTGKLDKTPTQNLGLQPGEWVKVKSFEEILETVDKDNKNRGLGFDTGEMRMHCNKSFVVERFVERIINDRTGKMLNFKNRCLVLKDVYCSGETTNVRMFCPRAITPYWREIWLERIEVGKAQRQGHS